MLVHVLLLEIKKEKADFFKNLCHLLEVFAMIIEICKIFARKGAPLDAALDAVHKPYHWWPMAAPSRWARSSSMEIPGNVRWHFGWSHLQEQGYRGSKEGMSAKHL